MGDSEISSVLSRYESMRLQSFRQMKELLRGSRDDRIHTIGRSVRNINKDGRADGVRRFPNIWQKVINKGGMTILKVHKCCTSVNKVMSEISNCCHYILSNPCILYIGPYWFL